MSVKQIGKRERLPSRKVTGVIQRTKEWKDITGLMEQGKEASVKLPSGFCGLSTPVNSFRVALSRWAVKHIKKLGKYDVYVVDGTLYAVKEDKY